MFNFILNILHHLNNLINSTIKEQASLFKCDSIPNNKLKMKKNYLAESSVTSKTNFSVFLHGNKKNNLKNQADYRQKDYASDSEWISLSPERHHHQHEKRQQTNHVRIQNKLSQSVADFKFTLNNNEDSFSVHQSNRRYRPRNDEPETGTDIGRESQVWNERYGRISTERSFDPIQEQFSQQDYTQEQSNQNQTEEEPSEYLYQQSDSRIKYNSIERQKTNLHQNLNQNKPQKNIVSELSDNQNKNYNKKDSKRNLGRNHNQGQNKKDSKPQIKKILSSSKIEPLPKHQLRRKQQRRYQNRDHDQQSNTSVFYEDQRKQKQQDLYESKIVEYKFTKNQKRNPSIQQNKFDKRQKTNIISSQKPKKNIHEEKNYDRIQKQHKQRKQGEPKKETKREIERENYSKEEKRQHTRERQHKREKQQAKQSKRPSPAQLHQNQQNKDRVKRQEQQRIKDIQQDAQKFKRKGLKDTPIPSNLRQSRSSNVHYHDQKQKKQQKHNHQRSKSKQHIRRMADRQVHESKPKYQSEYSLLLHQYLKLQQNSCNYSLEDYRKQLGNLMQKILKKRRREMHYIKQSNQELRKMTQQAQAKKANFKNQLNSLVELLKHSDIMIERLKDQVEEGKKNFQKLEVKQDKEKKVNQ